MSTATVNRENVISYLAQGFRPSEVAKVFSVSPGYITQLTEEEGFKEAVAVEAAKRNSRAITVDNNYEEIELSATQKILEKLRQGFFKPTELLAVAQMANKATRKAAPMSGSENGETILHAQILLPVGLVGLEIIKSSDNQVLRIGETSLNPVSKSALDKMAYVEEVTPKESKESKEESPKLPFDI